MKICTERRIFFSFLGIIDYVIWRIFIGSYYWYEECDRADGPRTAMVIAGFFLIIFLALSIYSFLHRKTILYDENVK